MNVIHLDVSELEPPEPYSLAVNRLSEMPKGSRLNIIHRREPFPLYQTADEMGFEHRITQLNNGLIQIEFWHRGDVEASPV